MMDEREEEIFNEALEIADAQLREAYLTRACENDSDLRKRVDWLLEMFPQGDVLERTEFSLVPKEEFTNSQQTMVGQTIGNFKILEQLGEGGMGSVYVAEQSAPVRRQVAFKIIKAGMDTHQVIARFEAERQALALMNHPNIAKVLDAGATDSGRPYFVMDLVRGVPITEFCDAQKLDIPSRLRLFREVCGALQHAHQKGIIHRDLKPSNILVELHDVRAVPKLIDFGIAKATNQRLTERTLYTRFSQMIGTPMYMSPEQAHLSGLDVDTRSDIYSLGVLLYELLTGTTPISTATMKKAGFDEVRRLIREDEPPRPSARISTLNAQAASTLASNQRTDVKRIQEQVRGDMDWVVIKALEKDRTRRYQTAIEFAEDVRRFLEGKPVAAHPPSTLYTLKRNLRRHSRVYSVAALVVILLVGGGVFSGVQAYRAQKALQIADSRAIQNKAINNYLINGLLASAKSDRNEEDWLTVPQAILRAEMGVSFGLDSTTEGAIASALAGTLRSYDLFQPALRLDLRAYWTYRSEYKPNDDRKLIAANQLARTYCRLGRRREASAVCQESLASLSSAPADQALIPYLQLLSAAAISADDFQKVDPAYAEIQSHLKNLSLERAEEFGTLFLELSAYLVTQEAPSDEDISLAAQLLEKCAKLTSLRGEVECLTPLLLFQQGNLSSALESLDNSSRPQQRFMLKPQRYPKLVLARSLLCFEQLSLAAGRTGKTNLKLRLEIEVAGRRGTLDGLIQLIFDTAELDKLDPHSISRLLWLTYGRQNADRARLLWQEGFAKNGLLHPSMMLTCAILNMHVPEAVDASRLRLNTNPRDPYARLAHGIALMRVEDAEGSLNWFTGRGHLDDLCDTKGNIYLPLMQLTAEAICRARLKQLQIAKSLHSRIVEEMKQLSIRDAGAHWDYRVLARIFMDELTAELQERDGGIADHEPLVEGEYQFNWSRQFGSGGWNERCYNVREQQDGKVLLIGSAAKSSYQASQDILIARYLANGVPDKSFNGSGTRLLDFGPESRDIGTQVLVDEQDRIIAAGVAVSYEPGMPDRIVAARLSPEGRIEASFEFASQNGDPMDCTGIVPNRDGSTLLLSVIAVGEKQRALSIVRLDEHFQYDEQFGDKVVSLDASTKAWVVHPIQDKILIAGAVGPNAMCCRLQRDGTLDRDFTPFVLRDAAKSYFQCMAVSRMGEVFLGGQRQTSENSSEALVVKLDPNGNEDLGFRTTFARNWQTPGKSQLVLGLHEDRNDRLNVVGTVTRDDNRSEIFLSRFSSGGAPEVGNEYQSLRTARRLRRVVPDGASGLYLCGEIVSSSNDAWLLHLRPSP